MRVGRRISDAGGAFGRPVRVGRVYSARKAALSVAAAPPRSRSSGGGSGGASHASAAGASSIASFRAWGLAQSLPFLGENSN